MVLGVILMIVGAIVAFGFLVYWILKGDTDWSG